jgi:hypothetical protein
LIVINICSFSRILLGGLNVYWQKLLLEKTPPVLVVFVTFKVLGVSVAVRLKEFEPQNVSKGQMNC